MPISRPQRNTTVAISAFCELPKLPDKEARIVHRAQHCYVILNSFPYTSGHVMVVPFARLDELKKLTSAGAAEMMALAKKWKARCARSIRPTNQPGHEHPPRRGSPDRKSLHEHTRPAMVDVLSATLT